MATFHTFEEFQQAMHTAVTAHQRGDLEQARKIYQKAIKTQPDDAQIHYLLGVLFGQQGQYPKAEKALRKALSLAPKNPDYLNHLGLALTETGQLSEAQTCFAESLQLRPDHVDTLNNQGVALKRSHEYDKALAAFEQVLALQPDHADALTNRGSIRELQGDIGNAKADYTRVLSTHPDHEAALVNLCRLLIDSALADEVEHRLRQHLQRQPHNLRLINLLALAMMHQERHAEAEELLRLTLKELGENPASLETLAKIHLQQRRHNEALRALNKAIQLAPDRDSAWQLRGSCHMQLGNRTAAEKDFRKAFKLNPDNPEYLRDLSRCIVFTDKEPVLGKMLQRLERGGLPPLQKADLLFALGKAHDDIDQPQQAFAYYLQANSEKRSTYDYDPALDREYFQAIQAKQPATAPPAARTSYPGSPIFILGMPRSGTSLVEKILASHSRVEARGELNEVKRAILDTLKIRDIRQYPQHLPAIDDDVIEQMRHSYLSHSGMETGQRITDKMPFNFQYIGIIRRMFPDSPILHCRRNPADTCVSIFKHHFIGRFEFGYELAELGQYYNAYHELMAFWQRTLPGHILDVGYEDLIDNPEQVIQQILNYCDLPWEDACMSFHQTPLAVQTASMLQVRKPLYKTSINQWQAYKDQLAPLLETLDTDT